MTRPTSESVQTTAEFQYFPRFHCLQSWFSFPTCHDVTVSLTHADLPDRKNKSRLLHDVTPQGRVCTCKWQTSLVQNVCSSYSISSVEKAEAVGV